MGTLADALNFERQFTVRGVTFTARRLTLAEIMSCAVDGILASGETDRADAVDKAEEMICGDSERVLFPRHSVVQLLTTASPELDEKDAEALATMRHADARRVLRFVVGMTEEGNTESRSDIPKKKARRLIGWLLERG